MGMERLSDEEMINYYSKLVSDLGGKVSVYYLDETDTDSKENVIYGEYKKRVVEFLKNALNIK